MSSPFKLLLSACLLAATLILLISSSAGDASATIDPNNDFGDAVTLSNNVPAMESLNRNDDPSDFYKVQVSSGDVLEVDLEFGSGNDFDLYLYDPSHYLVTNSEIDNVYYNIFKESISITISAPGQYFLEVWCCSGSGSYTIKASTTAEWTVLVYMDGDNDLEPDAITDFLEMSAIGSTDEMNIVVQMDRISGHDSSFGGWTGVNRYLVSQGTEPTVAEAVLACGEMNMGAASTLSGFINWGLQNYPANHYMLVLWDHGANWEGVCVDDSSSYDILTPNELATAFATVRATHPGFTFDVIGFDACVMSSLEVYYEIYGYADYFIASQLNEPAPGWNYAMGLGALASNPLMNGLSASIYMADAFVESYATPYPGYFQEDVAMTVVDASIIPDVVSRLNTLSAEMISRMPHDHNYYQQAWLNTVMVESDYLDLLGFADNLRLTAPTAAVRSYAYSLYNATLSSLEYVSYFDVPGGNDAGSINGISIFFPGPGSFDNSYRTSSLDMTAGSWDEMLLSFLSNVTEMNDPVAISSRSPLGDLAVTVGSSQSFSATVDDSDDDTITYLWYWDGALVDVHGSGVTLLPDESELGLHVLTVVVSDGASSALVRWMVDVVTKADLGITDFLKWDVDENVITNITSGRPSYAGATVANSGGTDCVFDATCYLDGVPFCVWNGISLEAGASVMLQSLPFQLSDLGTHTIQFLLDPLDEVDEGDETNNGMAFAMNVVPAEWTVLVYMDGDNNLEPYMVDNFLQMSSVGSDANVSVVVQFDRIGGYDARYGDWRDCLRFYVVKGMLPYDDQALIDLGEVNMGSGETLEDFLLWGMQTFQAERYVVVLKDHGNSWYGCCFDQTSSNDRLTMAEISSALSGMTDSLGRSIDVLVMDDCLMGSLEVAVELCPFADHAVVSETVGWTSNYDYSAVLSFMVADPGMGGEELALGLLERMHLVDDAEHITQCAAAYDLREVDGLVLALNSFANDLYAVWMEDAGVIETIRLEISHFQAVHGMDTVDLGNLVEMCMQAAPEGLLSSGTAVLQNLSSPGGVVLGYRYTDLVDFCRGMSIYFPGQKSDYVSVYTDCDRFISQSIWDDLLRLYLTDSPPLTLMFVEGTEGLNGWFVSDAELFLQVYDPTNLGYGTFYSLGGAWTEYFGPFVLEDGRHELRFYSVGVNAASEMQRLGIVNVDTVRPTVQASVDDHVLTLTGNDAGSGVTQIMYSVDGGPWSVYGGAFAVGTDGHSYSVRYHAVDAAGNIGADGTVTVGEDDEIAPVSSAEVSGTAGSNGWHVSAVIVTLSATDDGGSGLQGMTYSIDGGEWTAYVSPIQFSTEGEHSLNYRARDNFGNLEAVRSLSFKIDLGAPQTGAVIGGTPCNGWYTASVTASLDAVDEVSGISSITYRVNGGSWAVYTNPLNFSTDGTWFVEWNAADNAGNAVLMNVTVRLDTVGPVVSYELAGFDEEGWGLSSSAVGWSASDAGSGVSRIYWRTGSGNWTPYAEALSFEATGDYLVQCYAVDEANNSGPTVNVTVRVDVSAPTTLLSLNGTLFEGSYLNSVSVGCEITDPGIGGTVLWYRAGDGSWAELDGPLSLGIGTHALWYYATDALGNREEVRSINLTVIGAFVPGQVIGLSATVGDGKVRLSWAAPDDGVLPITSFMVYRSSGSDFELLATVTGTSYVDEGAEEGITYAYLVVAANILGEGPSSSPLEVQVEPDAGSGTGLMIALVIAIAVVAVAAAALALRRKK